MAVLWFPTPRLSCEIDAYRLRPITPTPTRPARLARWSAKAELIKRPICSTARSAHPITALAASKTSRASTWASVARPNLRPESIKVSHIAASPHVKAAIYKAPRAGLISATPSRPLLIGARRTVAALLPVIARRPCKAPLVTAPRA